jgi:hypothetical protein
MDMITGETFSIPNNGILEKPHGRLMHLYKSRKRKVCTCSVDERIKVR